MTKAQILASHGDLRNGGSASMGIGSADVDLSTTDAVYWSTANPNGACPISLQVTADGDVKFQGLDGNDDTWSNRVAGDVIPIAVQKVYKIGTTASVKAIF